MRASRVVLLILLVATLACLIPYGSVRSSRETLRFAVWGMPFEDRLFEDIYARGFERRYPAVTVDYQRYQDLTDKYFAWHLLGQGADVMRVRITDYHAFVARGMLEPLNRFINDPSIGLTDDEQADYMPAIWSLLEVQGNQYALPSDNAQYGLYYNKASFDLYNLAHPTDLLEYPSADWTWDDLRETDRKLTVRNADGYLIGYGVDFDLWAWPYMAFLAQAGGGLWDAPQTTTLINSPQGLEALQLIVDLLPHSASMRAVGGVGSAVGPDKLFAAGQTAMLLDGSWRAPDLERVEPDLDFAIAPLPRHRRSAVVSGSVLWAINIHSNHKESAWRMIRWMTNREESLRYWDTLRVAPPARLSVMRSKAFRQTAGLVDDDGTIWVHPMPAEKFDDRAAWLLYAVTVDPDTGSTPGFVPVAPYQKDLEDSIEAMLKRAVSPTRAEPLQNLLDQAAEAVHRIIDRDRNARGLLRVERNGRPTSADQPLQHQPPGH
ncbi:MAG: sugar ABC transporter substrate-binding protein [Planctomycetota bacterium]|nr:sugar ABC transporter substrate-binding protein [Planctomycetota bacterium]